MNNNMKLKNTLKEGLLCKHFKEENLIEKLYTKY